MAINIGDQVHSPVWDSFRGFYIESYKVLAKQGGVLTLEHVGTFYPGGQYVGGSLATVNRPESDFALPLIDRLQKIVADVQAMLAQFDPSKYRA